MIGAFTDSDSFGGGTDGEGHRVQGKYQVTDNVQLGATFFVSDKGISGPDEIDFNRLFIDLVASV